MWKDPWLGLEELVQNSQISLKTQRHPCQEPRTSFIKLYKQSKIHTALDLMAKEILSQKHKAGGTKILNFNAYYRVTIVQKAWHWHQNGHVDQGDRTKSVEISSCFYSQLTLSKDIHHRKGSL